MKKRILSLLLALALLCAMLPQITWPAHADPAISGTCGDNLTWRFDASTGTLTIEGSGKMYNFDYNAQPWYAHMDSIEQIVFPAGLTSIGERAFEYCTGLTSITLPAGLTSIGDVAFCGCTGLTSVTLPDGLTEIGDFAFDGCTGLTSVTLPAGLTSIGRYAFYGCTGLTSVTFPDGLTSIGEDAFYGCTGLTSVTFPDGLTEIGKDAFSGCTGLTSVTFPDGLTSIGNYAFYGCTGLTSVTFPDGLTSIGNYAFYGCTGLTSVTFPDGLTKIVAYAFYGCTGLTSVTFPDGLTSIGKDAFYRCTGLTSVTFPDGLTSIGEDAFYCCTGLTSVTFPDGLTSIGEDAFYGCTGLTSFSISKNNPIFSTDANGVLFDKEKTKLIQYPCGRIGSYTVPNSVTSIGDYAFDSCTGLTSVTFPDGLTSIGRSAFEGCIGLTSVTFPDGLTSIGVGAFDRCIGLTSVTFPDGLTSIGSSAFENCTGLTSVTFPDGLTSIGDYAFWGCTGLTSVTFPAGLTSIGYYAFWGCTGLTEIVLPASLTTVGVNAFSSCNGLTDLYYGGTEAQWTTLHVSVSKSCRKHYNTTDPTNHWTVEDIAPTCTEPGGQSKTCACGYNTSIGEEIPALGHEYQDSVTIPTCVDQGYTTYTCSRCGDSYVDSYTDALGHNIVNGVCTVCGLVVVSEPVITSHPEAQTVGLGKYATFTVVATGEYLCYQWQYQRSGQETWNDWAGKTSATLKFKGTSTNNAYRYRCVVSNAAGSETSEAATLTVIAKPVISTNPEDATVVLGKNATFTVEATGENLRYQWQYQRAGQTTWHNWSGKTSATLTFRGTETNNAYRYRCVVTNEGGSTTSEAATLTVIAKPVITTQPQDTTVVLGEYATFTVETAGENLRYQWQYKRSGQNTWYNWSGKTSATLTFRGTETNNAYQYRCVVSNEAGSKTSEAATLTVISKPVITTHPEDATVVQGAFAAFIVEAAGDGLSYQWQYKQAGEDIWNDWAGKTSATLTFRGAANDNACQYRCVVTNAAGSVTSNAATLTVISKPEITSHPEDATVLQGQFAVFIVEAAGENLRYQWQYKQAGEDTWNDWESQTSETLVFRGTTNHNACQYRCVVTNAAGSVISNAATLTIVTATNSVKPDVHAELE